MRSLLLSFGLLFLAGCGSGGNSAAVTPVVADASGTYRLAASTVRIVAPQGEASSFVSYSGGTLRLFPDSSYTRTVSNRGESVTSGSYHLGTSVNTILNSREGTFVLTTSDPQHPFAGSYQATGDFILTLIYHPYTLPDQGLMTRSDIWIKQSDSPRQ